MESLTPPLPPAPASVLDETPYHRVVDSNHYNPENTANSSNSTRVYCMFGHDTNTSAVFLSNEANTPTASIDPAVWQALKNRYQCLCLFCPQKAGIPVAMLVCLLSMRVFLRLLASTQEDASSKTLQQVVRESSDAVVFVCFLISASLGLWCGYAYVLFLRHWITQHFVLGRVQTDLRRYNIRVDYQCRRIANPNCCNRKQYQGILILTSPNEKSHPFL